MYLHNDFCQLNHVTLDLGGKTYAYCSIHYQPISVRSIEDTLTWVYSRIRKEDGEIPEV